MLKLFSALKANLIFMWAMPEVFRIFAGIKQ